MAESAVWAFARVLRTNWFAAMSGSFSVPFATFAVFSDQKYQQLIWAALALAAFGFAAYRIWKVEYDKTVELQRKLDVFEARPTLKCSFNMNDPGCVRPNTIITVRLNDDGLVGKNRTAIQIPATYYRLKVEAQGGNIPNCQGRIISIKRAGSPLFSGEAAILTFAPAENSDSVSKTIF